MKTEYMARWKDKRWSRRSVDGFPKAECNKGFMKRADGYYGEAGYNILQFQ